MSLILSIKDKGSFYVDHVKCTVERILGPTNFKLRIENAPGSPGPKIYEIGKDHSEVILPSVSVCASNRDDPERTDEVQISVDAPSHIKIYRESIYNEKNKKKRGRRRSNG